ncbi:hypothetical protein AOQ87_00835 [Candidatus Riesia pediculischaeffi]|uniref:Uncharacterized protein n=1 Tax=Candidatus Riesia pediculischaeffi TaxID=428411 RepID=A0A1V0HK86_9ENTR|nr:hypothetical protein [Candidatus Riesia pediculischaeffi]ARC53240.1 hypothetical protein AOQ87_00835 [Candidatus Riesia pediculischaeffi]
MGIIDCFNGMLFNHLLLHFDNIGIQDKKNAFAVEVHRRCISRDEKGTLAELSRNFADNLCHPFSCNDHFLLHLDDRQYFGPFDFIHHHFKVVKCQSIQI